MELPGRYNSHPCALCIVQCEMCKLHSCALCIVQRANHTLVHLQIHRSKHISPRICTCAHCLRMGGFILKQCIATVTVMMMRSNQDGLITITTHFSQRFESDCTVLSPSGFVKGQQGPVLIRRMLKKGGRHFLFRPRRSTKGGWWLRSISWRWQVDQNVTLISQNPPQHPIQGRKRPVWMYVQ